MVMAWSTLPRKIWRMLAGTSLPVASRRPKGLEPLLYLVASKALPLVRMVMGSAELTRQRLSVSVIGSFRGLDNDIVV